MSATASKYTETPISVGSPPHILSVGKNCRKVFAYSQIPDTVADYYLPMRPAFPPSSVERECPIAGQIRLPKKRPHVSVRPHREGSSYLMIVAAISVKYEFEHRTTDILGDFVHNARPETWRSLRRPRFPSTSYQSSYASLPVLSRQTTRDLPSFIRRPLRTRACRASQSRCEIGRSTKKQQGMIRQT